MKKMKKILKTETALVIKEASIIRHGEDQCFLEGLNGIIYLFNILSFLVCNMTIEILKIEVF